ncbi:helix-turn-helix transcriptional regulator [Amycolatopsis dongchuanensis]|uniref:HTH cro/C1-type domain-containing protein n=1 Tax=Amycolatopsis dongchuanensis TaxID=1070866 RepID=A0ABP9QJ79_9PSEU
MRPRDPASARPVAFAAAVGNILRELRVRRGWTRADLSSRTGGLIAPSSISGYESGYRALKLELLASLCAALGVRVEAVIRAADHRSRAGLPR